MFLAPVLPRKAAATIAEKYHPREMKIGYRNRECEETEGSRNWIQPYFDRHTGIILSLYLQLIIPLINT